MKRERVNRNLVKPESVSVVVRCFNEEKHIEKLLYGIKTQNYKGAVQVVVVDSGSTDNTVAIAERFSAKVVSINPEEFSFGRSLNVGCSHAEGEYLVFASAHVYPIYNDWIMFLLDPFKNKNIALCYGKQRGGENTKFSEKQVFEQWFKDQSIDVQETPFCNNANCAIRRDLWLKYPYDETLVGLEDLDWAKKVIQDGYKISYSAEAVVAHIHEESPRQTMNRYMREAIALKRIDPDQSMGVLDYSKLLVENIASDYVHAALDGCLMKNLWQIPVFRTMQFTGAFVGFRQIGPVSAQLKRTFYYPPELRTARDARQPERKRIDYAGGLK